MPDEKEKDVRVTDLLNEIDDSPEPETGEKSDSDAPPDPPKKKKRSLTRIILYVFLGFVALRVAVCLPGQRVHGPRDAHLLITTPPEFTYDGPGQIFYFGQNSQLKGSAVKFLAPFHSEILDQNREVIVFLPAGYEKLLEPLPLVIIFHGYLDQPLHMGATVIEAFEYAITIGQMPPSVLVFPDISLGGSPVDNPDTPLDDRLGSWAVNSNRGRYHDYVMEELLPWIYKNYPVREDPYGTALMGYSAGGHIALNLTMKHPNLAMSTVSIAGTIDTRYSINGFRRRPYNPAAYRPIEDDKPKRVVVQIPVTGKFTDEWAFWPVFNSDEQPGPVWREDKPVWERLRDENPMDMARDDKLDMTGHAFYLVAGQKDGFFYQHHIAPFSDLLVKRGAKVYPDNPIRPGGHTGFFVKKEAPDAAKWLGKRLREIELLANTSIAETETEAEPENVEPSDAVQQEPAAEAADAGDQDKPSLGAGSK